MVPTSVASLSARRTAEPARAFEISPDLVAGIQARNERAFRALFEIAFTPLAQFASRYAGSYEAGEDVVQDVMCRLWQQGPDWKVRGSARAYLYAAVRNTALNVRRRRGVEARYQEQQELTTSSFTDPRMPDQSMGRIRAERMAACYEAVAALTERQRSAFELRYDRNLTVSEVASVLGVTPKAAEKLLARVVAALRSACGTSP